MKLLNIAMMIIFSVNLLADNTGIEYDKEEILKELNLGIRQFLYLEEDKVRNSKNFRFTKIEDINSKGEENILELNTKEFNQFIELSKKQNRTLFGEKKISFYIDKRENKYESYKYKFFFGQIPVSYISKYFSNDSNSLSEDEMNICKSLLVNYFRVCEEKNNNIFSKLKKYYMTKIKKATISQIGFGNTIIEDKGSFYLIIGGLHEGTIGGSYRCYIEKRTFRILKTVKYK